eukprot:5600068-Amphidinium_carterae.1
MAAMNENPFAFEEAGQDLVLDVEFAPAIKERYYILHFTMLRGRECVLAAQCDACVLWYNSSGSPCANTSACIVTTTSRSQKRRLYQIGMACSHMAKSVTTIATIIITIAIPKNNTL